MKRFDLRTSVWNYFLWRFITIFVFGERYYLLPKIRLRLSPSIVSHIKDQIQESIHLLKSQQFNYQYFLKKAIHFYNTVGSFFLRINNYKTNVFGSFSAIDFKVTQQGLNFKNQTFCGIKKIYAYIHTYIFIKPIYVYSTFKQLYSLANTSKFNNNCSFISHNSRVYLNVAY